MVQTEIAVVGAGPAGMNAAVAAAELGLEVTLIDGYPQPGGQYFKQKPMQFKEKGVSDRQRKARALIERLQHPDIKHLSSTRVWDIKPGWHLELIGPGAPEQLQAQAVILATGAYDRPAAFPGWTLPGVMSVGGAQMLVKTQRVLPGRRCWSLAADHCCRRWERF